MAYSDMYGGATYGGIRLGGGGIAVGGNAGMSPSQIPEIKIPTLQQVQAPQPTNLGAVTVQPPKTEISAAADPRQVHVYDEMGRMRAAMEGVRASEQERALGQVQEMGDRAQRMSQQGAFARGASPDSGVSRVLGAKAQSEALRMGQKTAAEMATAGMRESANMLGGEGSMATQIAATQQGQAGLGLQSAGLAQQVAALNAAQQAAALDREMQARLANQNAQLQLAGYLRDTFTSLPGLYTG